MKKACNSNHNTISKKETQILLQYYKGIQIDENKLENLHKPAKKLYENPNLSNGEKLEILYDIETEFTLTGQDKIPMNDKQARKMKEKKETS